MMTETWETDGRSPVQTRRRACLADSSGTNDPAAVLLVSDPRTADRVRRSFAGQPFELHPVHDTAEALLVAGRTCPNAIVLAPAGGRLSPAEFLDVLYEADPGVPVVVGVGRDGGELAARAASRGATVTGHPFEPAALLALLRAALATPRGFPTRPLPIELGRLRIDSVAPRMWLDEKLIRLPLREHLVLRYLAARPDAVVTRRELVTTIWGDQTPGSDNSLSVHVTRLRRRLAAGGADVRIEAVRGLGYQLTAVPPNS